MTDALFAHNILMTGHILPGAIYQDLMSFITNDKCEDVNIRRMVRNGDDQAIFAYAKQRGQYKD